MCHSTFGLNYLLIIASCLMWNCSINQNPFFYFPLTVLKCDAFSVLYGDVVKWLFGADKTHISTEHVLKTCSLFRWRCSFLIMCSCLNFHTDSVGRRFKKKKWLAGIDQKTECSSLITANLHTNNSVARWGKVVPVLGRGTTTRLQRKHQYGF